MINKNKAMVNLTVNHSATSLSIGYETRSTESIAENQANGYQCERVYVDGKNRDATSKLNSSAYLQQCWTNTLPIKMLFGSI